MIIHDKSIRDKNRTARNSYQRYGEHQKTNGYHSKDEPIIATVCEYFDQANPYASPADNYSQSLLRFHGLGGEGRYYWGYLLICFLVIHDTVWVGYFSAHNVDAWMIWLAWIGCLAAFAQFLWTDFKKMHARN